MVLTRRELEQHCVGVRTRHSSEGLLSNRLLTRGSDNVQLHLALQHFCVELLHQLILGLTLFSFESREAQVKFTLFLFRRIGQRLHSLVDHLAHVLGHHRGPLGFLCKCNIGCETVVASRFISWLTARLPMATKDVMFSMVTSILDNRTSIGELSVLRPITSQCLVSVA